jgi:hypothetical protein
MDPVARPARLTCQVIAYIGSQSNMSPSGCAAGSSALRGEVLIAFVPQTPAFRWGAVEALICTVTL